MLISSANNGLESVPEPVPSVLVGGGVVVEAGVAVSPWNDWNGVAHGDAVTTAAGSSRARVGQAVGVEAGVAVSPWKDWNAVGQGVGAV
jgi:hypothetical protein